MSRVLAVAGELSGDQLLAPAVEALVARGHQVEGVGGPASVLAGLRPLVPFDGLAGHGLVEAVHTIPPVLRAAQRLRRALHEIDAVLLVDFPELNSRLLRWSLRPVAWVAPPQAWAWRAHRARRLRRAAWVGCLFDFAARWYRGWGVPAVPLGHPMADRPALPAVAGHQIALLPGSRGRTVARLLPLLYAAAARYTRRHPGAVFHLGCAPGVEGWPAPPPGVCVVRHDGAQAALAASATAWAGAGTATLEVVLAGRPVLVCARLHPSSEALGRRLVRVPLAGLPNLILGRAAFPERVFEACVPRGIAEAGLALTQGRTALAGAVAEVRRRCTPARPVGLRVADAVEALLRSPPGR